MIRHSLPWLTLFSQIQGLQVCCFPRLHTHSIYVFLASIRHRVLQLAVIFMCGVAQLSPGAYFLRRDLFPSIAAVCASVSTPSIYYIYSNFSSSSRLTLSSLRLKQCYCSLFLPIFTNRTPPSLIHTFRVSGKPKTRTSCVKFVGPPTMLSMLPSSS
jgi:hypothetical protein